MMLNCVQNQSTCDWYSNILYERETVEKKCLGNIEEIESLVIEKTDKEKREGKLKIPFLLREYIEKLNEKSELLMTMMQDLSREYIQGQSKLLNLEGILIAQKEALEKVESENQELEQTVNEEIKEIREKFIRKWKELDLERQEFENVQKELHESCEKEKKLTNELNKKKLELRKLKCCIKSLQKSMFPQKITMKMFDKLRRKEENFSKRYSNDLSSVQCYQEKLCKIQRELQIVHKVATSKLKMVKKHDEWRVEQLMSRKEDLETMKEKVSETYDDCDNVLKSLKLKISLMEKDVSDAGQTIKTLQAMTSSLLEKESVCRKVIKPSTHGQPKECKKPGNAYDKMLAISAVDYMGSKFIKYEPKEL